MATIAQRFMFPMRIQPPKIPLPIRATALEFSLHAKVSSFTQGFIKVLHSSSFPWRLKSRARCAVGYQEEEGTVEVLRVPDHWLAPSRALQESEWLRVALHKWLDDEYCPEVTNIEISKMAADSYYRSLLQRSTDLGDILLQMIRKLETISYQDSFHGAFSSANAAVSLIAGRIELEEDTSSIPE